MQRHGRRGAVLFAVTQPRRVSIYALPLGQSLRGAASYRERERTNITKIESASRVGLTPGQVEACPQVSDGRLAITPHHGRGPITGALPMRAGS
jgi:hypothetical protein